MAVTAAREARPGVEIGLVGELGAEAACVALADGLALDFVSVPPASVPVARLCAALEVIRAEEAASSSEVNNVVSGGSDSDDVEPLGAAPPALIRGGQPPR